MEIKLLGYCDPYFMWTCEIVFWEDSSEAFFNVMFGSFRSWFFFFFWCEVSITYRMTFVGWKEKNKELIYSGIAVWKIVQLHLLILHLLLKNILCSSFKKMALTTAINIINIIIVFQVAKQSSNQVAMTSSLGKITMVIQFRMLVYSPDGTASVLWE